MDRIFFASLFDYEKKRVLTSKNEPLAYLLHQIAFCECLEARKG